MDTNDSKQIAQTILEQLGGRKFIAMTGARHFSYDPSGVLTFRIPIGKYRACQIVVNDSDLYDVHFYNWNNRRTSVNYGQETSHEDHHGVYCEDLRDVFEAATGLRTSMGTMGRTQRAEVTP